MKTKRNNKLVRLILTAITLSFFTQLNAEVISSDIYGYSIDFPEGFSIADCSQDERSVLFEHTMVPVQTVIRVWPSESDKNSADCLNSTLKKLSAKGEVSELRWRNQDCSISKISVPQNVLGQEMEGWAVCIPLPSQTDCLCVISYCPKDKFYDLEQFLLSIMDSIMIDRASRREAGPVTSFAFPKTSPVDITLNIAGQKIKTQIDKDDSQANQFVVDREFAVFKIFASTNMWKEAWQRFYRLIAKDAMGRVKKPAFDISAALFNSTTDELTVAQALLTWTQGFGYERVSATADKADFTNIPAVLAGRGSDCDSRSMLLMTLFKNMNIDSVMYISVEYSHAMAGVYLDGKQGQYFELDGKKYLTGETTAKDLTWGMISADMQDRSKWIPVELYD
ncbi:MAG: hypothetical protein K6B73_01635 [Treponema sp.]|nr:hypothetical protein [Treponema sp.]